MFCGNGDDIMHCLNKGVQYTKHKNLGFVFYLSKLIDKPRPTGCLAVLHPKWHDMKT